MAMKPQDTALRNGQRQPTQRTLGARWKDHRRFSHTALSQALGGVFAAPARLKS